MINNTENHEDAKTECFYQDQVDSKKAGNISETNGEEAKPPAVRKLL